MLVLDSVSVIIGLVLGFALKSWITAEGGLKNMFGFEEDK